jgi:mannose-6-phosphate isomerase-like protein (cupin superfamily)
LVIIHSKNLGDKTVPESAKKRTATRPRPRRVKGKKETFSPKSRNVKKAASKRENRAAAVAVINKPNPKDEFYTDERCWILEVWRDNAVTVARARVARGVTTKAHLLRGVVERYLIVEGRGIAPKVSQSITNSGACDLIFYCICTPPFTQSCYKSLE